MSFDFILKVYGKSELQNGQNHKSETNVHLLADFFNSEEEK